MFSNFLYSLTVALFVAYSVEAKGCPKAKKCAEKAVKLGHKCFDELLAAQAGEQLSGCDAKWQNLEMLELQLELKAGDAMADCMGDDVPNNLKCPTMSGDQMFKSKRYPRRASMSDSYDGSYDEYDYEDMPESCLKAYEAEEKCWEMVEESECEAAYFCDVCFEKSELHDAQFDVELEMMKLEKECPDEGEDKKRRRRKRFARR